MTKIIAIFLILASASAMANPLKRYDSSQYTCSQLQDILQQDGEINIVHTIGYGTYYADANKCATFPYRAEPFNAYEPSRDRSSCFLGYGCHFYSGQ